MNLAQLRTLVSTWVDDPNNGYFTAASINGYLNNAQKEAQKILLQAGENWYVKCAETPVNYNQCAYQLPEDFLKEHRLELVLSGTFPNEAKVTLGRITIQQQDLIYAQVGQPTSFFFKKDKLVLHPIPDTTYTAVRMLYSYRVADMTLDTESPDVPEQYHEYLAVLATLDCFYRDGRDPAAFLEKKRYYEEMMKRDCEDRIEDSAKTVVITDTYGWDGGFY